MIRRSPRLMYRELPEGARLMHLDTGSFYELNSTGTLIWSLLATDVTFSELVASVERSLVEPPPALADAVGGFLAGLAELDLVEIVTRPG